MRVRFIYSGFNRHADDHPELRETVPCEEYFGGPSLGIAMLAAMTPDDWEIDFRDDRIEDIGLDDPPDLVAVSCFTPSAKRAMEIADAFREVGSKVVAGGIFPTMMPQEISPHVDAVVQGEGEGIWQGLLEDVRHGRLKSFYDGRGNALHPKDLPLPRTDLYIAKEGGRYKPDDYPVQISRGCPMKCSACVIPEWMGRKMRHFDVSHVMGQIDNLAKANKLACFTEDTSFFFGSGAQRHFADVVDALIEAGQQAAVSYIGISMPLLLVTKEAFFHRIREAGFDMFYLVGGFDPITRGAFTGKNAKALARAEQAIQKAHDVGIEPYTSFLVGNDDDDEGTFDRMLEFANKTNIKKAEFAIRTPYPGTPDYHMMVKSDRLLHRDWSKYNDANVTFQPTHMSPERLLQGYLDLWKDFYSSRMSLENEGHRDRTIQF